MVVVQTIGSVDMPGRGSRKMPSPRQYVAIVATWLVLMLVAGANESAARAARAIAWVIVLAGMVVGPFGTRTVGLFNQIATTFSNKPTPAQTEAPVGNASPEFNLTHG